MNINELEELAKAATPHVGKVCDYLYEHYLREGHVDFENADLFIASERPQEDAAYFCAANPSAILELIAAYREAVAALSDPALYCSDTTYCDEFCCREKQRNALATAKRLGVE